LTGASASRNISTASPFVHSIAPEESLDESHPSAQVLFDFTANSEFELDVSGEYSLLSEVQGMTDPVDKDGTAVRVLEPDDGSGWVKVMDLHGKDGLVPASYLQLGDSAIGTPPQQSPSRKGPSSKRYGGSFHARPSGKFILCSARDIPL